MKNMVHRIVFYALILVSMVPSVASAHATPVEYMPQSSATIDAAPASVTIRFSERLDEAASTLRVAGPSGELASVGEAQTDPSNARVLSVPLQDKGAGTYLVSWSVVSSDDGHFTKGTYPFAVGAGIAAEGASHTEILTITTASEALGMAVELMGNGIVWAVLLLFIFAVRPLLRSGAFDSEQRLLRKGYTVAMLGAIFLVCAGGALQIILKTQGLALLREADFWQTVPLYIQTVAGSATLYRLLAALVVLVVFLIGRNVIFRSTRITPYEIAMLLAMCVFAYFRALVSHATANPFFPELSVAVNFVHLIEKDFWAGAVGIVAVLALVPRMRQFLLALMPRAHTMLAVDFAAISITACYIVWLHLKSFDNLFTTQWGGAFLQLLIAAALLVGMRFYHVASRLYRPALFSKLLPGSLAAEFAFGILVVYFSSVVIITSPPLVQPQTSTFTAVSNGITVRLERAVHEDGMLLLSARGASKLGVPVVAIADTGSGEVLSVDLSKRFEGGYAFPAAILAGAGPFDVSVSIPQSGGYDAQASFQVNKGDFDVRAGYEAMRPFDTFTLALLALALLALAAAFFMWRLSGMRAADALPPRRSFMPELGALAVFLIAAFLGARLITGFGSSVLSNPFKAECERDGNMWHIMLPSKAGIPASQTPQEGCMWGMGNFMYMFSDKREYDYYSTLPHAVVTLEHTPATLVAGVPATLTVSLKNADGTPARLFVDMEKLVHAIIISKDQSVFAHIHPDDTRTLTAQEIEASTFTLDYLFPKSGVYLISIDYANGLTLESKQFVVDVAGTSAQTAEPETYFSPGTFEGFSVTLDYSQLLAGEVSTLRYTVMKDGAPVTNIIPYLSAAMHISAVKNDLSAFIHTHGEVHPPGAVLPPILLKDGQVVHSMAMMILPPTFGPTVETHLVFPTPGLYTVWGQFKVGNTVVPTSFTVEVE